MIILDLLQIYFSHATLCDFTVSILTKLVQFVRCEQNLDGSNQIDTFEPSRPRMPLSKTVKTGNSSFFCNNATQTKNYNYVLTAQLIFHSIHRLMIYDYRNVISHVC